MNRYTVYGRYAILYGFGRDLLGLSLFLKADVFGFTAMNSVLPFLLLPLGMLPLYIIRRWRFPSWADDLQTVKRTAAKNGNTSYSTNSG